jgi:hypothetical protein
MVIKNNSFISFVLEFKSGNIQINPVDSKTKSDLILYANNTSAYLKHGIESGLSIQNPGEYEVKDIFVDCTKVKYEDSLCFTIVGESITVGVITFLEDASHIPLDFFESVDVLLIAAGGGPFLSPEKAIALANKIAPSVAIYYGFSESAPNDIAKILDSVEEMKKEISNIEFVDKSLKLDKDFLDSMENTVHYVFN